MAHTARAAQMCCCRGVFHRDIKPRDPLINTKNKLIDFGCGGLLQKSSYETFCGTQEYCPPEYFKNRKYHGKAVTLWSLGVLLFKMMCGCFPQPKDFQKTTSALSLACQKNAVT